jgi:outer membrane receptor protein involved in Fe transport
MWVMQESLNLAETRRMGADLGLRYQLNDWLYFDADANYTYARSIDKWAKLHSLAPDFTSPVD